jgi:hypothetical protein
MKMRQNNMTKTIATIQGRNPYNGSAELESEVRAIEDEVIDRRRDFRRYLDQEKWLNNTF